MPRSSTTPGVTGRGRSNLSYVGKRSGQALHVALAVALDVDELNRLLNDGGVWPHGHISTLESSRIGVDFGFSGAVCRIRVSTESGTHTLVAKYENSQQINASVSFYRHAGHLLVGDIPILYGQSDEVIVFEDVSPAIQGDDSQVSTRDQKGRLIELLARLHSATWLEMLGDAPKGLRQWSAQTWDEKRWRSRMNGAKHRYPKQMTPQLEHRLEMLHQEVPAAIEGLAGRPMAWTHRDVTFDNVLWRPDGSPVLLDWSNSAIGPPVTDLIPLLDVEIPGEPGWAISTYTTALVENGVTISEKAIEEWLRFDIRLFVRGIVGFAGLPGEPEQIRLADWRDRILDVSGSALAWVDGEQNLG